ncbi:MAG: ComEC/Rec2 family competence protein [Oscillospiraceae bacterium]
MIPPIIIFAAAYFIGTGLCALISVKLMLVLIAIGLMGFTLALCLIKHKAKVLIVTALLGLICSSSFFFLKTVFSYNPIISLDEKSFEFSGQVKDILGDGKYEVTITSLSTNASFQKFDVILTTFEDISPDFYDVLEGSVTFNAPEDVSTLNKKSQNIFLYGFASNLKCTTPPSKPPNYCFLKLNRHLCSEVSSLISPPYDSLINAVLLGQKQELDANVKAHLNSVGLAHLLAISGLHLSIIAVFCLGLFGCFFAPALTNIFTLLVIWGFTFLSGFSMSTLRAAIMMSFSLLAPLFSRTYSPVTGLSFAFVFILFFNPFAILNLGFLLSFSATLGLVLYSSRVQTYILQKLNVKNKITSPFLYKIIRYLVGIFSCSAIATIFVLPFSVFYCSQISFLAIPINLLVIPLFSVIIPLAIISLLLCFLPFLSVYIGKVIWILCFFIDNVSQAVGSIPFAMLPIGFKILKYWVVATALFFAVMCLTKNGKHRVKLVFLTCVISLLACTLFNSFFFLNSVEITSFSGYKGKAVVFLYSSKATVISLEDNSFINKSVMDYLDKKGVFAVDTLVLADKTVHDVKGLKDITSGYHVKTIVKSLDNNANEFTSKTTEVLNADTPVTITQKNLFDMSVNICDSKMQIVTNIGINRINITQNFNDLKNINYNLSYFYGKPDKLATTSNGNCVIMLSKSAHHITSFIDSYNKTYSVVVRTNTNEIRKDEY